MFRQIFFIPRQNQNIFQTGERAGEILRPKPLIRLCYQAFSFRRQLVLLRETWEALFFFRLLQFH